MEMEKKTGYFKTSKLVSDEIRKLGVLVCMLLIKFTNKHGRNTLYEIDTMKWTSKSARNSFVSLSALAATAQQVVGGSGGGGGGSGGRVRLTGDRGTGLSCRRHVVFALYCVSNIW